MILMDGSVLFGCFGGVIVWFGFVNAIIDFAELFQGSSCQSQALDFSGLVFVFAEADTLCW